MVNNNNNINHISQAK